MSDKERRKNKERETHWVIQSYEEEANNCDNNRVFEFIDLSRKRKWRGNRARLLRETLEEIKDFC